MSKQVDPEVTEVTETDPSVPVIANAGEVMKKSKADLRASIFSTDKTQPRRELITYNGVQVEFVVPTVKSISELQADEGRNFIISAMIQCCVVPGTDETVFEEADYETMVNSPMTTDFSQCVHTINGLLNFGVDEKVKN